MLRPGQIVACCILALLTLGVLMVNSADMSLDPETAISFSSIVLSRSSAYMVLALLALAIVSYMPVRRLAAMIGGDGSSGVNSGRVGGGRTIVLYAAGVAALLLSLASVYAPVIGKEKNGSHRWLEVAVPGVGAVSVQPSEIAKWGMIVLVSWYAVRMSRGGDEEGIGGNGLGRFFRGLVPALMGIGAVAGFIVLEDLGTGILVGAVSAIVLLAAGAKVWHLALLAPPAAAALVAAVMTSEYRVKRLTAFLDPYADPEKTGFHMIQSMTAVANGEVFGRGLGHGLQKFGYLPEDRTDFLFAVICEELGVVGAGLVVFLYMTMLWSGYSIIRRESSQMLKLVGLGVLCTVGLQAAINLAVVTGLGPTKGIALPLLSSGGTGWILTAASVGVLLAMDRAQMHTERVRVHEIGDQDGPVTIAAPGM